MARKKQGSQKKDRTRGERRMSEAEQQENIVRSFMAQAVQKAAREPVEAMSEAQGHYILGIQSNDVTFGLGPAGTGKTFVATALACDDLIDGTIERIYVVRPMVETEDIGYLPGDVYEKFLPYFRPVYDVLTERLGKGFTDYLIREGRIEVAPLAFLRGRTLKNAVVILDEAQNTTPKQMKMFMTRLGQNCRAVINGDVEQCDLDSPSGLPEAFEMFKGVPGFGYVEFRPEDVRRSDLAQRVVDTYEKHAA